MKRILNASLIVGLSFVFGCGDDQYDPQTWIKKLESDDHRVRKAAVEQLRKLEDPAAIKPLAKMWATPGSRGGSPDVLSVIVELAREVKAEDLHPDEVKAGWVRPASWNDASATFEDALSKLDGSRERTVKNAEIAAKAIAEGKIEGSIPALVSVVNKEFARPRAKQIQLEAIRALGNFGNSDEAVNTLIAVMEKKYENPKERISYAGTAVIALEKAKNPKAIKPLIKTGYRFGGLHNQVRRALVALGDQAIPEVRSAFRGPVVGSSYLELAKELKFSDGVCETKGPESPCQQPGQLQFKAATLLGDLLAHKAVPDLVAELKKPGVPAYYAGGNAGPMQHAGVLEALRKIGKSSAQGDVLAFWRGTTTPSLKAMGIETYSWLATNKDAMESLRAIMMQETQDDASVRLSAGRAYARLATTSAEYANVKALVTKYRSKVDEWNAKAKPLIALFDEKHKAFNEYERKHGLEDQEIEKRARKLVDLRESLASFEKEGQTEVAEQLKQQISVQEAQLDTLKGGGDYDARIERRDALKKARDEAGEKKREPETKWKSFQTSLRTAELNLMRIKIGMNYGSSADKLVSVLDMKPQAFFDELASELRAEDWKEEKDKMSLKLAAVERAMISLGKMGSSAAGAADKLCEEGGENVTRHRHLRATKPVIRESVLFALNNIAARPHEKCVAALDSVIENQSNNTTLKRLVMESRISRSFLSRGK